MTTIADLSRSWFNDFASTTLIFIDGLVEKLNEGSTHVFGLGHDLVDSDQLKRLRNYADGTRSAYLFLSEKELRELPAEVRDQLDILTAFHGINETINLVTRAGLQAEDRCASLELSDEDTQILQHAISIYRNLINISTEIEYSLLSEIHSSHESVVDKFALIAARRGDSGIFNVAVHMTVVANQR